MNRSRRSPDTPLAGLFIRHGGAAVPLDSIDIRASVVEAFARVDVTQHFTNHTGNPLEVIYRFPLDNKAAVCSLVATIGDKKVVGRVQEKEEAKDTYDDAIASGDTAVLLEQDSNSADIFSCSLGNLPPNESAEIVLSYVTNIPAESDRDGSQRLRFSLPLSIYPRYTPSSAQPPAGQPMPRDVQTGLVGDAAHVPQRLAVRIHKSAVRGEVTCATHTVDATEEDEYLVYCASGQAANFAADLVLFIPYGSSEDLTMYAAIPEQSSDADKATVMLSYAPSVLMQEFDNDATSEVVFIIDCSGSMRGERIANAKRALISCLAGLPAGSLFNIVRFGSRQHKLYDRSREMTDATKAEAVSFTEKMQADLGGTEILAPLQQLMTQSRTQFPRSIFVLTDGAVSNVAEVQECCRQDHRQHGTKYFSFGIGAGASHALVDGLAENGGGHAEYLVEGEALEGKVNRQLARALLPCLIGPKVAWGIDPAAVLTQAPSTVPAIPQHTRMTIVAEVDANAFAAGMQPTIRSTDPDGSMVEHSAASTAAKMLPMDILLPIAAKTMLGDLETRHQTCKDKGVASSLQAQAVDLSKRSNVMCKWTSFVSVAERDHAVVGQLVTTPVQMNTPFASHARGGAAPGILLRAGGPVKERRCLKKRAAPSMLNDRVHGVATGFGGMVGYAARESSSSGASYPSSEESDMFSPPPPPAPMPACMAAPTAAPRSVLRSKQERKQEEVQVDSRPSGDVTVISLLKQQRAAGNWEPSPELWTVLGKDEGLVLGAKPADLSTEAWVTAVVVAFLQKIHADAHDQWMLSVKKATKWLRKSASQPLEQCIAAAEALL